MMEIGKTIRRRKGSFRVNKKKKKTPAGLGLVDVVFSWSIADVLNQDFYKDKTEQIPATFSSSRDYLKLFVNPLLEETHADLHSCMKAVYSLPSREICDVRTSKNYEPPKELLYVITLERKPNGGKRLMVYEPAVGDLIALTDVVPKCVDDLNRTKRSCTMALVQESKGSGSLSILSSKPLCFQKGYKLFALCLTNLTTNMRMWAALHPDEGRNMKIINSVLSYNPATGKNCPPCSSINSESSNPNEDFNSLGLDASQKAAVSNCLALTKCSHQSSVKLIWGPPGTGKTKTIALLLFCLLKMHCRTLICAPTNVAVMGVVKRLMTCLSRKLEHDTYGLGDVVLFGNGKRMEICEHEDLRDAFLQNRVDVLVRCLNPQKGWQSTITRMICLLENPEGQYLRYVEEHKQKEERVTGDDGVSKDENIQKKTIIQDMKANEKKNSKKKKRCDAKDSNENLDVGDKQNIIWSFEEFFTKKFLSTKKQLILYLTGLYTHLPTYWLPRKELKKMIRVLTMLQELETLLHLTVDVTDQYSLKRALLETGSMNSTLCLCGIRLECLKELKSLRETFSVPVSNRYGAIKNFCLKHASLVFCTVSSSAKLHTKGMKPFKLVIVDEAAQLKECESCIPLQLPGVCHAVLVGDEKQLPAMVMSKISVEAGFGRSLFERLVTLGHEKHLLNVQYRMHPCISLFPNEEFYGNQIKNGPNVMEKNYEKCFIGGKLFGPYSFINVTNGKETFDNKHSIKNIVEVSVVAEIVSKLHKESAKSKKKVRVGCISPYKAQVFAIQEALGKTYSTDAKDTFSVNVRSVDGFQGGEEDIIIISTVWCNGNGSIGFLDNHQRTNVALTRPRFCLWILGNGATLLNSNSIWQKLVSDAKNRGCFHNACDDDYLSMAVGSALIELGQLDLVFSTDSLLFKAAKWKVCFSAKFHKSMATINNIRIHKEVAVLLAKILNGWRQGCNAITYSSPLEWCDVKNQVKLVWTVDIVRENDSTTDAQVIKVLDILPKHKTPQLEEEFDNLFKNCTSDPLRRCLWKRSERGQILPLSLPVVSAEIVSTNRKHDPSHELASQLAAMSLRDVVDKKGCE